MDNNKNALLRYLYEMQPAMIYALADKVQLFNGFELCKRIPVAELRWSEDGSSLVVRLADGETLLVTLTLSLGQLASSCDCGTWSPRGRCPHIVATLATLKKAVSPAAFPMLQLPADYLAQIRSQLPPLAEEEPKPEAPPVVTDRRYSLLIERHETGARMRLLQDGVPVTVFEPGLAPAIREFVRVMYSSATRGKFIEEFLTRFGPDAPIVYAGPDVGFSLHFDPVALRSVLLHLDLCDGAVHVNRVLDDGTPVDDSFLVTDDYLFDLRQRRIQRVGSGVGRFIKKLLYGMQVVPDAEFSSEAGGFRTSSRTFNLVQFSLSYPELTQFLQRSKLCVDGALVRPRAVEPRYRLNIVDLGDEKVELVGEGVAEETVFQLSRQVFWFFPATGRIRFPQPLRAKKRVQAIIRACFATLAGKSRGDKEKIMRLALNAPDFAKRGVKTEARKLISSFWQAAIDPLVLLLVANGEWTTVRVSGDEEARLLAIPYRLFGPEIFLASEQLGGLTVERKPLMKNLAQLREELEQAGFQLAVGGEELETVSWSFTLDATQSSIDWFELRPEIRFEGELVDEGELRAAVQGGGVFRKGNKMMILDERSSHALSLFSATGKREVVRVPRLQILDWITLRRSGVRVLLSPEDERIIESLTNFQSIPTRSVPNLHAVLRNYQREGYGWLAFLYEHRFGACLADDMGLGKTIQAIALIAGLKEGLIASDLPPEAPHLVVVPPSLIFNWESEIARFYPDLKVGVYRGQGRRAEFSEFDLVLTSYGVVQRDIEILGALQFNVIVFDEAQAVKNIHAETTGAVRKLKGRFKVTLTGTPVENHLGEYFSVMDLALPGLLGPYELFRKQMGREGTGFLETLIRRTHPFILRRTKDMIAAELPPKVETDIYLEMSPKQKALYVRTVAQVKSTVAEAYRSNSPGQARIIALTAILKLRQICLSSRLLVSGVSDRSPKIDFLVERLQELFDEGHSVLVFSQFTSFLDVVQEGLSHSGISFLRLDGSTPVSQRKDLVQRFQESERPSAFLLSLKAGGRGLNLTRASYVFHLDPWWNPAVENQASDRAHRIGQQRQVTITRLLMRHSIEEKMMELKKRKLKLYRALLEDAEHGGAEAIGREDFEFLLG
jgi:superfamily II DNA or RNA helicase